MKKYLLPVFGGIYFIFLSASIFAADQIADANSVKQLIHRIETLPSGSLINFTFKSKIDGSFQPTLIKVPDGYIKTKSWPLLVVLHGLGDKSIVVPSIRSMVQIGPFGRGDLWYRDLGEKDVFECIELARQLFNIDSERVYLCGFSMGGAGTYDLGLKYPDMWAACVPVCGSLSNLDMVANAKNLAFWINTGSADQVVPAKSSRMAYEKAMELGYDHWKYTEHENMGHSFWIDWGQIEKWLLSQKRAQKPSNISFLCETPSRAYWAEITGKINRQSIARLDIETISQTIRVKTSNMADYRLHLKDAPVKLSEEITIIEDDKKIYQGHIDSVFNRKHDSGKTDKACEQ